MGEVIGEAEGFRSWPAETTGDLVIECPGGSRIVTRFGNGYEVLEHEVWQARSKFDQMRNAYKR